MPIAESTGLKAGIMSGGVVDTHPPTSSDASTAQLAIFMINQGSNVRLIAPDKVRAQRERLDEAQSDQGSRGPDRSVVFAHRYGGVTDS